MMRVAFGNDDGSFFLLVIHMGDAARRGKGPRSGNGTVKDQFLAAVQDTGQVDVGFFCRREEKINDRGNGKGGNDLEVFFINERELAESGTDARQV
jgi:hypothetical protein